MKVKECFSKGRYYLLGLLIMYCSVRRTFRPNGWLFLIEVIGFLILFSIFLNSLGTAVKKRNEQGYKGFILPIFCLATLFVSFWYGARLGVVIRDAEFREKITDYNSVVDAIKAGKVPSTKDGDDLKYQVDQATFKNLPPTVKRIWGFRRGDCELRVYFLTENVGGALGTHGGFVYIEPLKEAPCKKPFPSSNEYLTSMTGNWFSFFGN